MNTKISEAAVEAAIKAYENAIVSPAMVTNSDFMRAAITAALPHFQPQPAELAEQQGVGITADWVLGYLCTDAPEDSREAVRNAFTEWTALAATGKQQVGEQKPYAPEGYSIIADHNLGALRRRAEIPTRIERREVWYWQGNGEDFPESLNCPIIMHADTLRALLASRQRVGEVQGDALTQFHEWARGGIGDAETAFVSGWQAAVAERQPGAQVRDRVPQKVVSAISAVAVIASKESRHPVQKHIDTINAWLYAAPPAQGIDLGPVRSALQAAEGLCACCASVDGYSRNELHAFGLNMRSQFREALALITQRDAAPGVGS